MVYFFPGPIPPETLPNGRVIYRCTYGHFHNTDGEAWAC